MTTVPRTVIGLMLLLAALANAQPLQPQSPNPFAFAPREVRYVRVLLGERPRKALFR